MFSSAEWSIKCTSREIYREIRRLITKTSGVPNNKAICQQQNTKLKANLQSNSNHRNDNDRWVKLSKYNGIRALSTIQTKVELPKVGYSKEESLEFMATFPDVVRDLSVATGHMGVAEVTKRFAKVLQYNVPTGKKNRGLATVMAYKMLEKPENLTPENIRLANILGWCVELLLNSFLVTDDIMDNAKTRRGALCWYKNENVGVQAINDGLLLENSIYIMLKKYFSSHPCYVHLVELFHDITYKSSMGQSLDTLCKLDGKPRLDLFTMNRYKTLVKYKTAYISFPLPVASAMYFAKILDEEQHRQAKTISLEIGEFFQIQDDFLDCFGNPAAIGKMGTDIQEGKCSWLAVVALQKATPAQRKVMEQHYGRPEEKSIQIIRNLYEELNIPATYAMYEEESLPIIRTHIQQISKDLPHDLFFKLIKRIHKRDR